MKKVLIPLLFIAASTFSNAQKHEYVDLGLPSGTLWATCNIGAKSPEDYGYEFRWGETKPTSGGNYDWETYKYANGIRATVKEFDVTYEFPYLTKYCDNSSHGYNGFTDDKTELQKIDDAAFANWGTDWRMPTAEQVDELYDRCSHSVVSKNGKVGVEFKSINGNKLFIPAPSQYDDYFGTDLFWTSTLWGYTDDDAICFSYIFGKNTRNDVEHTERCYHMPIRPVCNNKHYIDLGLPSGTLWANRNIGATTPEGDGDHFAWGETGTADNFKGLILFDFDSKPIKQRYTWKTYQYGDSIKLKKYCTNSEYGRDGFVDNKTQLDYSDDVAYQRWGSDWCMPTDEQIIELIDECSWEHTTYNGKKGVACVGPNGNKLFFPISEIYMNDIRYTSEGCYWSRTLSNKYSNRAYTLYFNIDEKDIYGTTFERYLGMTIRPVRNKD